MTTFGGACMVQVSDHLTAPTLPEGKTFEEFPIMEPTLKKRPSKPSSPITQTTAFKRCPAAHVYMRKRASPDAGGASRSVGHSRSPRRPNSSPSPLCVTLTGPRLGPDRIPLRVRPPFGGPPLTRPPSVRTRKVTLWRVWPPAVSPGASASTRKSRACPRQIEFTLPPGGSDCSCKRVRGAWFAESCVCHIYNYEATPR